MKKLLGLLGAASILALIATAAIPQPGNPTCPTRPTVTSDNSCATTAFVHNVVNALSTILTFPATVAGSVTSGGIPYFSSTTVMSSSGVLGSGQIVIGGGAGNAPTSTPLGVLGIAPGYSSVSNCSLAASVSSNALIISLKDQAGNDPSATSPCTINFRSSSTPTGTYASVSVTAATSFSTATSGSTFGSLSSNIAFRLWITAFNNAGTIVLGVSNQSTAASIFPLNEGLLPNTTACNACGSATSAGVFYTTAAQSAKAFRILGYMDWGSGLATAGTWATGPTAIQMFGPGIKKPGEEIQSSFTQSATSANNGGSGYTPSNTLPTTAASVLCVTAPSYTPTASPNHVRVWGNGMGGGSASNSTVVGFLAAGSSVLTVAGQMISNNAVSAVTIPLSYEAINPSGVTTYAVYINGSTGTTSSNAINGGSSALWNSQINSYIRVQEIQG